MGSTSPRYGASVRVTVDLKHHLRVIHRSSGKRWFDALKFSLLKIQLIDKDVDYADRIGIRYLVVERFRKKDCLSTIVGAIAMIPEYGKCAPEGIEGL